MEAGLVLVSGGFSSVEAGGSMLPSGTPVSRLHRATSFPSPRLSSLVWSYVATSITFNILLCFIDTNLIEISRNNVVAFESILISTGLMLAVSSWHPLMRPWLFFAASAVFWWLILSLLKSEFGPKNARDIVIIPTFVMLGISASTDRRLMQKWLPVHLLIFLAMVYEALYPTSFSSVFNVKQYYIHTRGFQEGSFWNTDSELFVSATRPDERHLFPSLAIHRLSSIFLEPVSLENYVVVVTIFLLAFRRRLPTWLFWTFSITNLVLLVGSDGRMGATLCALLLVIALVGNGPPRWASILALPLTTLIVFVIVEAFDFQSGPDDFSGRLAYTVELLGALGPLDLMGLSSSLAQLSADSGIVYLIISYSIFGAALGWVFIFGTISSRARAATVLRCGAAIYLSGNLMVSASVFSIKTAALLWFLVGYADGLTWREQRSRVASSKRLPITPPGSRRLG